AALAAGIVARFSKSFLLVVTVTLLGWAAMSVRTLWVPGLNDATLRFTLIGLAGIVAVAAAGLYLRMRNIQRPWMMLGGLSMALGLASLTMAPR
ncbi:MAG TPA: hypothetical protein VG942_03360, partial [Hyphomonadaceae bacterium]|nr:hypothetical protein [Hyphomonadaceae bacterium]